MRSDSSMCSPAEMRIILSTATLRRWCLSKLDVNTGFLQTGQAERDVYVRTRLESAKKGRCVWLLLTTAYGLINANAKWKMLSDLILTDMGFRQAPVLLQLFVLMQNKVLMEIIAMIVDDFSLTGTQSITHPLIARIPFKVEIGTIANGSGHVRYFGINFHQKDDYLTVVNG